jgi:hypothetical protein
MICGSAACHRPGRASDRFHVRRHQLEFRGGDRDGLSLLVLREDRRGLVGVLGGVGQALEHRGVEAGHPGGIAGGGGLADRQPVAVELGQGVAVRQHDRLAPLRGRLDAGPADDELGGGVDAPGGQALSHLLGRHVDPADAGRVGAGELRPRLEEHPHDAAGNVGDALAGEVLRGADAGAFEGQPETFCYWTVAGRRSRIW